MKNKTKQNGVYQFLKKHNWFITLLIAILALVIDIYQNNQINQIESQIYSNQQMGGNSFLDNKFYGNGVGVQFIDSAESADTR